MIKLDQGLIWPGHICSNVFGPFPGSGKAFVGRHMPSQWPKMARNGPNAGGVWRPLKAFSYPGKIPNKLPDKPCPDQTLIKFDQPVWSLQGDLALQKVIFGLFGLFGGLTHFDTFSQMCPGQYFCWTCIMMFICKKKNKSIHFLKNPK